MLLGNEDSLPNATSSYVLPWLVPAINQNAEHQLALRWHCIHIQQFIQEVSQTMWNTTYCLAKCICYYQLWIHPLVVYACENRSTRPTLHCVIFFFVNLHYCGKTQGTINPTWLYHTKNMNSVHLPYRSNIQYPVPLLYIQ